MANKQTTQTELPPPLKWAGGKRWLVPELEEFWLPYKTKNYRLVEPFAGGLAVTLGLQPKKALINDINPYLINFYRQMGKGLKVNPLPWDETFLTNETEIKSKIKKVLTGKEFTKQLSDLTIEYGMTNTLSDLLTDANLKEAKKQCIREFKQDVEILGRKATADSDVVKSIKESFATSDFFRWLFKRIDGQVSDLRKNQATPQRLDQNQLTNELTKIISELLKDSDYQNLIETSAADVINRHRFGRLRARFNKLIKTDKRDTPETAALFYYLNRTGFNGLCRFNSAGEFNVPFGRYGKIGYKEDFSDYQKQFAQWTFACGDFEKLSIKANDFLYCDPPYDTPFTKYSEEDFKWEDQVRLVKWMNKFDLPMVLSNQATDRIVELYKDNGFNYKLVDAPRRISSSGDRSTAKEIVAWKNIK